MSFWYEVGTFHASWKRGEIDVEDVKLIAVVGFLVLLAGNIVSNIEKAVKQVEVESTDETQLNMKSVLNIWGFVAYYLFVWDFLWVII